jgi:hypothetical protein
MYLSILDIEGFYLGCLIVVGSHYRNRMGRHHRPFQIRPVPDFRILVTGFLRDTRPRELAYKRKREVRKFHGYIES